MNTARASDKAPQMPRIAIEVGDFRTLVSGGILTLKIDSGRSIEVILAERITLRDMVRALALKETS